MKKTMNKSDNNRDIYEQISAFLSADFTDNRAEAIFKLKEELRCFGVDEKTLDAISAQKLKDRYITSENRLDFGISEDMRQCYQAHVTQLKHQHALLTILVDTQDPSSNLSYARSVLECQNKLIKELDKSLTSTVFDDFKTFLDNKAAMRREFDEAMGETGLILAKSILVGAALGAKLVL